MDGAPVSAGAVVVASWALAAATGIADAVTVPTVSAMSARAIRDFEAVKEVMEKRLGLEHEESVDLV